MRIAILARPVVLALASALALAACSSTSNGSPTTSPSSSTVLSPTTSAAGPTGFPSTSTSAATSGGLTTAQAQAALLTATEIGSGFQQTPTDTTDDSLPCTPNDPPLDKQLPADVKVRADFEGLGGKALFSEEIERYADANTVAAVIAAGERGLACGTATVGGVKVQISQPTDLTTQLETPVDKAEGWSLSSTAINAVIIVAQLGAQIVVFSFGADPSVQSSSLPDSQKIVSDGLAKLAAALK